MTLLESVNLSMSQHMVKVWFFLCLKNVHFFQILISGLVVRGKHWLQYEIGDEAQAAQKHRFAAQQIFMDTFLSFVPTSLSLSEFSGKFMMEYSALNAGQVPQNVHILTLEEWNSKVLLRLEHIFEAHEDPHNMSKTVNLKLDKLFSAFDVRQVQEVILGANLKVEKLQRLQWNVMNQVPIEKEVKNMDEFEVTLKAFQIRTFVIDLVAKQ